MRIGIIIQARLGSTRMPGKVLAEFYKGKTILNIITENFRRKCPQLPIVVATSTNVKDDAIEAFCLSHRLNCFRGDEQDVLLRFIRTADKYEFDYVVRVCADNPFLDTKSVNHLVQALEHNPSADYVAYFVGDTPSIKTHYGFWAELAKVDALKRAFESSDLFYHEHVTNFLYGNPDVFNIYPIPLPDYIVNNPDIRLTVDTPEDFNLAQSIFPKYIKMNNLEELVAWLSENKESIEIMKKQIKLNSK